MNKNMNTGNPVHAIEMREIIQKLKEKGYSVLLTSAYVGTGLKELVFKLGDIYEKIKSEEEL